MEQYYTIITEKSVLYLTAAVFVFIKTTELTLSTREGGLSWAECAGRPVSSSRNTTPRLYTSEEGVKTPVSWYSGSMYLFDSSRSDAIAK